VKAKVCFNFASPTNFTSLKNDYALEPGLTYPPSLASAFLIAKDPVQQMVFSS
jgi:hypothetical protein